MTNGYDLHEMILRWWYLNGGNPFLIGAFKVAGACFVVAFLLTRRDS
jgi:hypothetical protein